MELDVIYNEDCLIGMSRIPDRSIDMILCDLPYGTTQCKWDIIIPFEPLWAQYRRVAKENAAIVLFGCQPFTSALVESNRTMFKYCWVWEKSKATGYLNAKKQPLRAHEDICVFYQAPPVYNPQKTAGSPYNKGFAYRPTDIYGSQIATPNKSDDGLRYPRTVIYFKTAESEGRVLHPTQKPVALLEYLIKTYTNEGEVVLDSCCGSGSTLVAAVNTQRRYIGFEKDRRYCEIARRRVNMLRMELPKKPLCA